MVHSNIDHQNISILLSCQNIYRGTTIEKILDYLWCDFSRLSADAFLGDPMIGSEYNDRFFVNTRMVSISYSRILFC